jgi:branched-chain amino acid transport system substrate-binding protein
MHHLSRLVLLGLLASSPAAGAAELKIAVVAPQSGNLDILGRQVIDGARVAAGATTAAGDTVTLIPIEESCADEPDAGIGDRIVKSGAVAAIGFLCSQSLEDALPALAGAKIPAITLSVRASILMEDALKKGWPLFRMAPSPTAERETITDAIFQNWTGKPFALLDDGTITSRETVDTVRAALEQKGMKPTFIDNFRPAQEVQTQLIRRLVKAGVTHVFAAADRGDMSVMARDARAAGLNMVFLGGDALNATDQPPPLEKGVLAVTVPDYQAEPAAAAVLAALAKENKTADGYVLPAHAAVTIVVEASEIAANSGASLVEALTETPFETAIGTISFTRSHELKDNPFRLLEWNGTAFRTPEVTQ